MAIFGRKSMDADVLVELRGIRLEIQHLSERLGNTPTRQELSDGYVTKAEYGSMMAERERAGWQRTVPIWLSSVAVAWVIFGPYIHLGK